MQQKYRYVKIKKKKQMKTLDAILIALGVFLCLFIITMIVLFCIYQQIPDTLVIAVLGSGSSEALLCCVITCIKKKAGIKDDESTD